MFLLIRSKQEYQLSYNKIENSYLQEVELRWINQEDGTKRFKTAPKGRILHDEKNKTNFIIELIDYRTEENLPNSDNKRVTQGKRIILKFKRKDLWEIILLTLTAGFIGSIFAYFLKNLFLSPVRISKSGVLKFKSPAYQRLYERLM
jgi:hypothetical protein